MKRYGGLLLALSLMVLPVEAGEITQAELQSAVEAVRKSHDLVGFGAAIAYGDEGMIGPVVAGERVLSSGDMLQPEDAFHIGSNTKMLTALIYARLVEEGHLSWGATLPELFPDLADQMHEDWREVRIEDLFAHRSGLQANPSPIWFLTSRADDRPFPEQRRSLVEEVLSKPAKGERGDFVYSNLGYMIAGAAIEANARGKYDEAGADYWSVFERTLLADRPEGEVGRWGLGPPGEAEGHGKGLFGGFSAQGKDTGADNPGALGPAGRVHVPLGVHADFLRDVFITGRNEPGMAKLLAPYPDETANYAMGWGVAVDPIVGPYRSHSGSNTIWLSRVTLVPGMNTVLVIGANQMSEETVEAVNELERVILQQLAEDE